MDNYNLVLKTLTDSAEPLKGQEIANLSGVNKIEVDKIIKKLKTEDKIISPKKCYYQAK